MDIVTVRRGRVWFVFGSQELIDVAGTILLHPLAGCKVYTVVNPVADH